ncbi:MAG TPA: ERF family protein [Thermomonas sp.]|nr:ERF family protein [Thermomonas sp.]
MSAQQLAPAAHPMVIDSPASILAVIERVAKDPNADVDKMERLMAMHRDVVKQRAEEAFNQAMGRVQAQMRRIGTDKRNDQTRSDYATYGKLDRALRPLYTSEGFALSFSTEPAEVEWVRVVCHVTHESGHSRKYQIDMPADGKGAKGNDVMTKTHATGSATQYGMRYLLKMIFNVAIGDDPDDDDGNGADLTPEQAAAHDRANNWIQKAAAIQHPAEFNKLRQEVIADYGSDINAVPALVRGALATAKSAVTPKD